MNRNCCSRFTNLFDYYQNDINSSPHSAEYMRQWMRSAKQLSKPMLGSCQLDP